MLGHYQVQSEKHVYIQYMFAHLIKTTSYISNNNNNNKQKRAQGQHVAGVLFAQAVLREERHGDAVPLGRHARRHEPQAQRLRVRQTLATV